MSGKEYWKTRRGFILAAIGSAIGLGNIWRFSWLTYRNGGGAFLLPYFIALLIVGIPLLILEFLLGNYFEGSSAKVFRKISPGTELVGWFAAIDVFVIGTYYAVVLAWVLDYIGLSVVHAPQLVSGKLSAGDLFSDLIGNTYLVVIGLLITWFITWYTVFRGIPKGIEVASTIAIPTLWILSIILVIRGVTLPGADTGINWYLEPDFAKLANGKVWIDAFGQILFTLSIMAGPLVLYAAYMPKKSELPNSAWITAFANCGFSFFFGFATWGIIGYMLAISGVPSPDKLGVPLAGAGLAFVTIPTAISRLPGGVGVAALFGAIFFIVLWLAGYTSLISIVEAVHGPVFDKFGVSRKVSVTVISIISIILGLVYVYDVNLIDPVDFVAGSTNLVWLVMLEAIIAGYFFSLEKLREYANPTAELKLGAWFDILVKIVAPIALAVVLLYGLYSVNIISPISLIVFLAILIVSILFAGAKWVKEE